MIEVQCKRYKVQLKGTRVHEEGSCINVNSFLSVDYTYGCQSDAVKRRPA